MNDKDFIENILNINTNRSLTVIKTNNTFSLVGEDEEENQLIEDITQKTIRSIKKRKIKKVQSNIEIKSTRRTKNNIRKHIDFYINFLKKTNKNEKTIHGYIKKFEVLIDYFNYKKIFSLNDITKKHCKDLQLYLLDFPKNLNKYEELKDKNIFELIDRTDIILDKYERLDKRTVDNYITRYKTLFNYFIDNDYVYVNYFLTIKNLKPKIENPITNFQKMEDIREQFDNHEIEQLLNTIKDKEIKNLIVIAIVSGCRINELVNLKLNDIINYNLYFLLDIKKSKTMNGIRKIPIHKNFEFIIQEQKNKKKDTDFLFFNEIDGNRLCKPPQILD